MQRASIYPESQRFSPPVGGVSHQRGYTSYFRSPLVSTSRADYASAPKFTAAPPAVVRPAPWQSCVAGLERAAPTSGYCPRVGESRHCLAARRRVRCERGLARNPPSSDNEVGETTRAASSSRPRFVGRSFPCRTRHVSAVHRRLNRPDRPRHQCIPLSLSAACRF